MSCKIEKSSKNVGTSKMGLFQVDSYISYYLNNGLG